jgi:NADPH2:quinone reductase
LRPGGAETLRFTEVPDPVPQSGEILVRVQACGINYPDVLIIEDRYQFRPPRPFAPGCELAGVVDAVGTGVKGWEEGDRLIATVDHGGLDTPWKPSQPAMKLQLS